MITIDIFINDKYLMLLIKGVTKSSNEEKGKVFFFNLTRISVNFYIAIKAY